MGLDSAGYNTSSLFQAKNYDPTSSALVNGLQSTATYDPTQQATSTPTSAARFLPAGMNSQNTDQGDTASPTQNLQSNNGFGTLTNALSSAGLQSTANAGTAGLTKTSNNAVNSTYAMSMPTNSKLVTAPNANQAGAQPQAMAQNTTTSLGNGITVSQATGPTLANGGLTIASQNQAAQAAKNNLTQYGGAQTVSVRTRDGNLAYYTFDSTRGTYQYVNTYDKNGQIVAKPTSTMSAMPPAGVKWDALSQQAINTGSWIGKTPDDVQLPMSGVDANGNRVVWSNGMLTTYKADNNTPLSAQMVNGAQLQTIAGTQLDDKNTATAGSLIAQQAVNQTAIAQWQKANDDAYAKQQATAAATAQQTTQQQALDYMQTHGGQLPPNLQAIANNTYSGAAGVPQAQQAGIAAAQQAYQEAIAHGALLNGLKINGIDTKASDAVDQATMNSLLSQYASQGTGAGGGLSNRLGAYQAAGLSGQAALNHEKAAATSYNNNMTNFANALNTQNSADVNATGNQLYSDIQGVQQIATALSQEMDQLGASARQGAQAQLDNLQSSLAQYQNAVKEFGQGSAQAIAIAKGIISAAGTVAAAVA